LIDGYGLCSTFVLKVERAQGEQGIEKGARQRGAPRLMPFTLDKFFSKIALIEFDRSSNRATTCWREPAFCCNCPAACSLASKRSTSNQ
jgi:hypothetical protein